jgi:hypothetical protein
MKKNLGKKKTIRKGKGKVNFLKSNYVNQDE